MPTALARRLVKPDAVGAEHGEHAGRRPVAQHPPEVVEQAAAVAVGEAALHRLHAVDDERAPGAWRRRLRPHATQPMSPVPRSASTRAATAISSSRCATTCSTSSGSSSVTDAPQWGSAAAWSRLRLLASTTYRCSVGGVEGLERAADDGAQGGGAPAAAGADDGDDAGLVEVEHGVVLALLGGVVGAAEVTAAAGSRRRRRVGTAAAVGTTRHARAAAGATG